MLVFGIADGFQDDVMEEDDGDNFLPYAKWLGLLGCKDTDLRPSCVTQGHGPGR